MPGSLRHPRFERALDELSAASDRVCIAALSTGSGLTVVAAYSFAHSPSGVFWAYAGLLIRGGLYFWAGDALRGRGGDTIETLFRVGLVAGLLEILVDWALIHWVPTGRLVYLTGNDVVLLGSPNHSGASTQQPLPAIQNDVPFVQHAGNSGSRRTGDQPADCRSEPGDCPMKRLKARPKEASDS